MERTAVIVGFIELGDELTRSHDRSRKDRGEKRDEQQHVDGVSYKPFWVPVDVDAVGDALKGKK